MSPSNVAALRITVALLCVIGCLPQQSFPQPLAKGKSKFLGCSMSGIPADFAKYWNQVTPENAGKWGNVEGSQGSFGWSTLDNIYNYAVNSAFRYKHHNLVWGQQQPSWIASLDSAAQRAEVERWIDSVGTRYPSMSFIDVVNEPFHAPPPYMNALGGSGRTGWDWVITSFTMARRYCFPGVKLLVNDYNVLQDNGAAGNYIALVDTLHARGLIDGIGIQGHYFEFKSPAGVTPAYSYPIATLKSNLDRLAATGLPVYISEFDINEADDSIQLQNYQTYFPLFWEDPGVKGITLWGYIEGQTWQTNAYLVHTNGTERPALQWLRHYLAVPLRPVLISPLGTTGAPRNPLMRWSSSATAQSYHVQLSQNSGFPSFLLDTTVADTLFQVDSLAANMPFYWRVSASNDSGASSYSDAGSFTTGDLLESVREVAPVPAEFSLSQNYPNPFNPTTQFDYTVRHAGFVSVKIYDLLGRDVATLFAGVRQPGTYTALFDGASLSSGMYFCRLQAGGVSIIRMAALLK